MPLPLIKKLAKKAKRTESYVERLWDETKDELKSQGMKEDEKRFYPYLVAIIKKKLEINESSLVLMRFKEFLKEQDDTKRI